MNQFDMNLIVEAIADIAESMRRSADAAERQAAAVVKSYGLTDSLNQQNADRATRSKRLEELNIQIAENHLEQQLRINKLREEEN